MLPYHMSELELKKSNKTMSMGAINNNKKKKKHELKFQTFIIHSAYIFQRWYATIQTSLAYMPYLYWLGVVGLPPAVPL